MCEAEEIGKKSSQELKPNSIKNSNEIIFRKTSKKVNQIMV